MAATRIGLMGFGRIGRDLFRIVYQSDDIRLAVRFQVSARLATSKEGRQVSFDTLMDPSGHVNLNA